MTRVLFIRERLIRVIRGQLFSDKANNQHAERIVRLQLCQPTEKTTVMKPSIALRKQAVCGFTPLGGQCCVFKDHSLNRNNTVA